jgi:hypothetical protein
VKDKTIDGALLCLTLAFWVLTGRFKEHLWENVLPWVGAICLIIVWHAVASAIILTRQISQGAFAMEQESPLFLPSGKKATSSAVDEHIAHHEIKIWGLAIMLCVTALLACYLTWEKGKTEGDTLSPSAAIAITPGTVWVAHDFFHGMFFIRFNYSRNITPINIMADYTITNTRATPIMIKTLFLEMAGKHGTWWRLIDLPTHQQIWSLDKTKPHGGVVSITLPEGFLRDKIENVELQAGQSVRGWMPCQIPLDYVALDNGTAAAPIRLHVADTAGDELVQILPTTSDNNAISTAMNFYGPIPGEDSANYTVAPYGQQ